MNSFELSKIFGPIFAAGVFIMGAGEIAHYIYHDEPEKPGYEIEVTEAAGGGEDEGEAIDLAIGLIASADIGEGESIANKRCAACHTFEEGGETKVGPNLWNIVNRDIAGVEGFKYSAALRGAAEEEPDWDYENLSAFILSPRKYAKGTSMGFAGLKKEGDRSALIAYLRTLSSEPARLPEEE